MIALAFVVIAICMRIPIPNLDLVAASAQFAQAGGLERLSLFALGTVPLFSALALAEIVKLVFPRLASREGNAGWGRLLVGIMVLLFTVLQGYGVLTALIAMGLMEDTAGSLAVGIAGFAGVSALLLWLADAIRLPGLDSGIWLLLAIPMVATLPRELVLSFEMIRSGAVPAWSFWLVAGGAVVAVMMVVLVNRLLVGAGRQGATTHGIPLTVLLWPPFLASIVTGYLVALPIIAVPDLLTSVPWLFAAMAAVSNSVLIPLFVYGYFRLQPAARREEIRPILTVVAVAQVLICVGFSLVNAFVFLPIVLNGGMLIVCVTVILALWRLVAMTRSQAT
ncbi:preprotein translocase subunit SecY [Shinella zoogloeoides]